MNEPLPHAPKIACIRVDRVGDMVCLLPSLASLRVAFPEARIDVLASPANASLLEHDPNVTHVHPFKYPPRKAGWRLSAAMLRLLRKEKYDVVLAFYSRTHTHFATAFSGARWRVGFDNKRFHRWFTTAVHGFSERGTYHEVDRNLALVEAIGVRAVSRTPRLYVGEVNEQRAQAWLEERDLQAAPLIALHSGAAVAGRRYPPKKLASAVKEIMAGAHYIVFAGPLDQRASTELQTLLGKRAHVFHGSLLEMAALLKRCSLAIMNDSGPMHVAAAVGVPLVGVFGPSDVVRWAPRGSRTRVVRATMDPHIEPRIEDVTPPAIITAGREVLHRR